ncbi:MAG: hypothetical protein WAV40_01215 [Microgenomates group bacterium]
MIKLLNKNIVGSSKRDLWVQAQHNDYNEDHKLLLVLQLKCSEPDSMVDLSALGSEILLNIEQKARYVGDDKGLVQIIDEATIGLSGGVSFEYMVAITQANMIFLCGKGGVGAYLSRGGKVAKLGTSWEGGATIKGYLADGDRVLLATDKLETAVGHDNLKMILSEDSDPGEAIAPLIHKTGDASGIAGIVSIVSDEKAVSKGIPFKISLRNEEPRRLNMWVGALLLALLSIMVGVGMVRRVKVIAEKDYQTVNSGVEAKIAETLSIGDLNPERARTLLSEARQEVESYLALKPKDEYRARATKLVSAIDKAEEQAFKKNDIVLNTVVELRVLVDELKSLKMKSDGKGNLVFIDQAAPRIVSMNIGDRSRVITKSENIDKYLDVAVSDTKYYVLTPKSVDEINVKKNDTKAAIEADEFWVEPALIGLFAGNLYIFDKSQNEIWKYPTLGDTFGGRRRWLAAGITPDLSKVVDMKVAGDIWLLTSSGKLERYSRGAPVKFSMDGFPAKGDDKKLSDPSALWVSESLIYVLENGASRITVFGDDGLYKSQYVNSEFAKASDLVVVDDKAYVMIDNVVKEFGL